jgi:hypothetical protein
VIQIVSFVFNNDTDLVVHAAEVNAMGEDIHVEMQDILDTWEGGDLKARGGGLVPKKSY